MTQCLVSDCDGTLTIGAAGEVYCKACQRTSPPFVLLGTIDRLRIERDEKARIIDTLHGAIAMITAERDDARRQRDLAHNERGEAMLRAQHIDTLTRERDDLLRMLDFERGLSIPDNQLVRERDEALARAKANVVVVALDSHGHALIHNPIRCTLPELQHVLAELIEDHESMLRVNGGSVASDALLANVRARIDQLRESRERDTT